MVRMSFMNDSFRLWLAVLLAVSFLCTSVLGIDVSGNCSLCKFPKHHEHHSAIKLLEPFCGKRYSVQDGTGEFLYNVGICISGIIDAEKEETKELQSASVVQTDSKGSKKQTVIGSLGDAEIMAGSNWISLEYEGGKSYENHCGKEGRRTIIMITCVEGVTEGNLRWLEENRNKSEDCYYLFELEHSAACALKTSNGQGGGLSTGSIVCIILGTSIAVYLVVGVLFMRFFRGAKGVHQIPNYEFWRDLGHLQADGCDFICRCGGNSRYSDNKPYHGIGDHQIESANDGDDLDEHLLPM